LPVDYGTQLMLPTDYCTQLMLPIDYGTQWMHVNMCVLSLLLL
jgi:hypothetical protein